MGLRSYEQDAKERYRQVFTVPQNSGDYASERITFGKVGAGQSGQSFLEFSALIEGYIAGATVELWLPQVADGTLAASDRTDSNYFNSGATPATSAGFARWLLSAWPGGQIRVKSGGTAGAMTISASGY